MSHTNSTANYKLPQFLSTDKPAWIADINPAMLAIDENLKVASDNASSGLAQAESAMQTATAANELAGEANSTANSAMTTATTANNTANTNTQKITDLTTSLSAKSIPAIKGIMTFSNTSACITSEYITVFKYAVSTVLKADLSFIPIGSGVGFDLFTMSGNPIKIETGPIYYLGDASVRVQPTSDTFRTSNYSVFMWYDGATTHVSLTVSAGIKDSMADNTRINVWGTCVFMASGVIIPVLGINA